jgi:hypothetical protein
MPFDVLVHEVADSALGRLLAYLHAEGFEPRITPTNATIPTDSEDEFPAWRLVRELGRQSYSWPQKRESYGRFGVFAGQSRRGATVHIGIGETERAGAWGRDRKYVIAFLTSGAPQVPLVEFVEVDDYASTRQLQAVIRGNGGGKKMYGPGEQLPDVYAQHFRTELYRDRIVYPRSWNKQAVIAREDDHTTMLNHALLQARRRGDV